MYLACLTNLIQYLKDVAWNIGCSTAKDGLFTLEWQLTKTLAYIVFPFQIYSGHTH